MQSMASAELMDMRPGLAGMSLIQSPDHPVSDQRATFSEASNVNQPSRDEIDGTKSESVSPRGSPSGLIKWGSELTSKLVNFVAASSPLRRSSGTISDVETPTISPLYKYASPLALDEEISVPKKSVNTSAMRIEQIGESKGTQSTSRESEDIFYSPPSSPIAEATPAGHGISPALEKRLSLSSLDQSHDYEKVFGLEELRHSLNSLAIRRHIEEAGIALSEKASLEAGSPRKASSGLAASIDNLSKESIELVSKSRSGDTLLTPPKYHISSRAYSMSGMSAMRTSGSPQAAASQSKSKDSLANESTASPTSPLRYSQRDLEKLRSEFELCADKQTEFLQIEVQGLQERYAMALRSNDEMRLLLAEYEKTMAQIVEARKQRPEQAATFDQLAQDKRQLEIELQTAHIAFQNLHQRYEELKSAYERIRQGEQTLRQTIATMQVDLAHSEQRGEAIRRHAEERIEHSANDLQRIKGNLEGELSAYKARLSKAELKITSLDHTIEMKTKENSELMGICDELIQKIDAAKTQ